MAVLIKKKTNLTLFLVKTIQFRYFIVNLINFFFVTFFWQVVNHCTLQTVIFNIFYFFPLPYRFLTIFIYCKLSVLSPAVFISRLESVWDKGCHFSIFILATL